MRALMRDPLGPRGRLIALVVALLSAFAVFYVAELVTPGQVEAWLEPMDWAAAPLYVLLATALGMVLVPGPVLAAASGVLFGPVLGTAVTLSAAILSSVLELLVGRHVGAEGMAELGGERMERMRPLLERHGLAAVVVQRLAPGVPDAPCSYLAGTVGVRVWQIALGTLIGGAPRAFAYTALGASLDDLSSPLGIAAIAVAAVTALVGFELSRRVWRQRPTDS